MLLILFILLGLLLGLIRGGRFSDPGCEKPNDLILPIMAFSTEALFSLDTLYPSWFPFLIAYSLLFWFCLSNIRKGAWSLFLLAGTLLNFLAIGANGFRMPVHAIPWKHMISDSMMEALTAGNLSGYALADSGTRLLYLSDVVAIAPFGYLLGFASAGDFILGIGAAILSYRFIKSDRGPDRMNGRKDCLPD